MLAALDVTWAAPIAAVAGALLVAVLSVRQQRRQHLREKMLDAADAFLTSMQHGLYALLLLARDSDDRSEARKPFADARAAADAAHMELARIDLLFGPDSKTGLSAREAQLRLDTALRWDAPVFLDALPEDVTQGDSARDDALDQLRTQLFSSHELAEEHTRDFARVAFVAIRSPGRFRTWDRVREPLRVKVWFPIRRPRRWRESRRAAKLRQSSEAESES